MAQLSVALPMALSKGGPLRSDSVYWRERMSERLEGGVSMVLLIAVAKPRVGEEQGEERQMRQDLKLLVQALGVQERQRTIENFIDSAGGQVQTGFAQERGHLVISCEVLT